MASFHPVKLSSTAVNSVTTQATLPRKCVPLTARLPAGQIEMPSFSVPPSTAKMVS
jgi:hypothetical protein